MNITLMKEKMLVFPTYLVPICKNYDLGLEDFLLLIYFWNHKEEIFDVLEVSKSLKIKEEVVLVSFNRLLEKKLIKLELLKDENKKRMEYVNLDALYCILDESFKEKEKSVEKEDVYTVFETEFGRTISSMEYEIIKAWFEKGFSEELILGALKEAVFNGANNLRYIDKILYEWQRKGYKTMKEVNNHKFVRNSKEEAKELFDYNWLDDSEG